jgi:hypothetical protein
VRAVSATFIRKALFFAPEDRAQSARERRFLLSTTMQLFANAPAVPHFGPESEGSTSIAHSSGVVTRTVLALVFCSLLVIGLILYDGAFLHWFVLPLIVCGTLIGADAIAFIEGQVEVMDPAALIGGLGMHFFFLAPLLHVLWDIWLQYVVPPPDWREWLGWMGIVNTIGIIVYRITYVTWSPPRRVPTSRTIWELDKHRSIVMFGGLMLVSILLQSWVYLHFGGISGFIDAYMEGEQNFGNTEAGVGFNGFGWIFMISESFPILAIFVIAYFIRATNKKPGWPGLLTILGLYFVLVMLFGGLKGSRSNTIWALFWGLGVIHFWVRRVTPQIVLLGTVFLLVFMYLYGFYKSVGVQALDAFQGSETRNELSRKTGRTLSGSLLGDLARADVQSLELYKMTATPSEYDYAWGGTYLGALSILIPRAIWPDRPPDKSRWTTELESGPGSYVPGIWQSSHVVGLAGEAMLNFGPLAVPLAYAALGLMVGATRRWLSQLSPDDSRFLLAPLVVMFSFILLVSDSDNDIFFLFKFGFIPLVAVFFSSRRFVETETAELV